MKGWFLESQDDLLIYHFSRIIQVNDRILSNALYMIDSKDIALALLDSGESQKLKVLKNVSKKRSITIQEDIDFYKTTYTRDKCDKAQEKIINAINDTILGISPQNKINKKVGIIRDYRNRFFTGMYTTDYHDRKAFRLDHQHTKSGRNWIRWLLWLILVLVFLYALFTWNKHSEGVWDKASKAGWPTHKNPVPK